MNSSEGPPIPIDQRCRQRAHELVGEFDDLLVRLTTGHVYRCNVLPAPPPEPGVYLFAEESITLHVGRTRDLQSRRRNQTGPKGHQSTATFAFNLAASRAREVHRDLPATRDQLAQDERFATFFQAAKEAIRGMDFRCVVIEDHAEQALFEIFASVALASPYNTWETH